MAFQITPEWAIDLSDEFETRVEDEKLIFWKTGITVVVAVFRLPDGTGKIDLLNQIQEKLPDNKIETLVSTSGEIAGLGYTMIHKEPDDKNRLSLYTFTTSDTSCLQSAFYLDSPDDLDWAKSVWKRIIFLPVEEE